MITIICDIIVMTIIVESSAVGGGIKYHQSHIYSVSVTRFKTVSFCGNPLPISHIYMSVVEMSFPIKTYRFHEPQTSKVFEFDICLEKCLVFQTALKIGNFP